MEVSRSDSAVAIAARVPFGGAAAIPTPMAAAAQPSPSALHNIPMPFTLDGSTAAYKPISSPASLQPCGGGGGDAVPAPAPSLQHGILAAGVGDTVRRKRGRPRKYDGVAATAAFSPSGGDGFSSPTSGGPPREPVKKRVRPLVSSKKQQLESLGPAGVGFTPHVITVKTGEDVSSKIMSFSQNGSRAVCVLSANGAVSNVTLRQAATSGGTATYEGRFELLSLSGSYLLSEIGGQRSRTGGLSVSLAGPDGRVLGGGVAGILTAASPVQVIVCSFIAEGGQKERQKEPKPVIAPSDSGLAPGLLPVGMTLTGEGDSPPSRGTLSESSGGGGARSPPHQSSNYSFPQGGSGIPSWKH